MPNSLGDIVTILSLISMGIGSLWSIIKLSEWWGNKGKEREERIELELEWIEDLTTKTPELEDTEIHSLIIKNKGKIAAEDVEIRLYKAEQNGVNLMNLNERYIIRRFESVKAGDSLPFNFIHDNKRNNRLITPAGNDRIFDRRDVIFTFHITGLNFETLTQKMIAKLDNATNRFWIINL